MDQKINVIYVQVTGIMSCVLQQIDKLMEVCTRVRASSLSKLTPASCQMNVANPMRPTCEIDM